MSAAMDPPEALCGCARPLALLLWHEPGSGGLPPQAFKAHFMTIEGVALAADPTSPAAWGAFARWRGRARSLLARSAPHAPLRAELDAVLGGAGWDAGWRAGRPPVPAHPACKSPAETAAMCREVYAQRAPAVPPWSPHADADLPPPDFVRHFCAVRFIAQAASVGAPVGVQVGVQAGAPAVAQPPPVEFLSQYADWLVARAAAGVRADATRVDTTRADVPAPAANCAAVRYLPGRDFADRLLAGPNAPKLRADSAGAPSAEFLAAYAAELRGRATRARAAALL